MHMTTNVPARYEPTTFRRTSRLVSVELRWHERDNKYLRTIPMQFWPIYYQWKWMKSKEHDQTRVHHSRTCAHLLHTYTHTFLSFSLWHTHTHRHTLTFTHTLTRTPSHTPLGSCTRSLTLSHTRAHLCICVCVYEGVGINVTGCWSPVRFDPGTWYSKTALEIHWSFRLSVTVFTEERQVSGLNLTGTKIPSKFCVSTDSCVCACVRVCVQWKRHNSW